MTKNQPAFPTLFYNDTTGKPNGAEYGLTKREYFAAMAMQGILANDYNDYRKAQDECDILAITAVNFADALIEALNKKP